MAKPVAGTSFWSGIQFPQEGSTWLQRMDTLTKWLVAFGRWLTDRLDPGQKGNPLSRRKYYPNMFEGNLSDLLEALAITGKSRDLAMGSAISVINSTAVADILTTWQDAVEVIYGQQSQYAKFVLAAKAFFKACESYEITVSTDGKLSQEVSAALGTEKFGLGGGGSTKRSGDISHGVSVKVSFVWVTLIELCDIVLRSLAPTIVPGIPESVELFNHGLFTPEQFNGFVRYAGGVPEYWDDLAKARAEKLQWRELIEYARRTGKTRMWIREKLLDRGIAEPVQREMMEELYWEIPTIQDQLHWLQRNVFNKDYVQRYKLMDGFEERFWKEFGPNLTIKGMRKEYAALHYAAHWIQPAPTQMQEFVYRLRPEKVGADRAFTVDDYRRILAEQDYAPLAQQWFVDTVYRVPALGYIRDMYRQGIISDKELVGYHQDLGYTKTDSERFLEVDRVIKARMRAAASGGWTPHQIADAAALQIIDRDAAEFGMHLQGFTTDETNDAITVATVRLQRSIAVRARSRLVTSTVSNVRNALRVGVLDVRSAAASLQALGFPAAQALGVAQIEATAAQTQRVAGTVRALKGAYHRGEIDRSYATRALSSIGIVPDAVTSYLAQWDVENTPNRKRRTASQIVTDIVEHGLSHAEATARLQRLGYGEADIKLFLADATRRLVTDTNALVAAQEMRGMNAVKELLSLEKSSGGLNKRIVGELQKQFPPLRIQKWLKLDLMDEAEAARILALYGWENRAIELWIEEAKSGTTKSTPASKAPQAPVGSGGGGGTPAGNQP